MFHLFKNDCPGRRAGLAAFTVNSAPGMVANLAVILLYLKLVMKELKNAPVTGSIAARFNLAHYIDRLKTLYAATAYARKC